MNEQNNKPAETEAVTQPKEKSASTISRRDVLKMVGAGSIGLLFGMAGMGGVLVGGRSATAPAGVSPSPAQERIPFYGAHQAGILTPAQNFLCFASFDLTTRDVAEVVNLFRIWTDAAAKMTAGEPVGTESGNPILPPVDTGEAAGLHPSRTTITFGVGPSFFDQRFGLSAKRPAALVDLPKFAGENLRPEWCGGDIGVQVCSDDLQVAFHAVRNLTRLARGVAVLRWVQEGFQRTSAAGSPNETPRNLMGFKDGTGNPDTKDSKLMNELVWAQSSDGPAWMAGGSYLVARRIRMRIEVWDRSSLADQEATFGRYRSSGAPLGAKNEFDPLPLDAKGPDGQPVIPMNAHVRLAHSDGKEKILRRSYSYSSGIDPQTGQLDAGLFFICYQRDIRTQFIPIQQRLAREDKLNEYISHVGSAVFACFPGVREGGYLGQALFEG
ncbi:deferrochelatase/peroxidase EfeB [Brevibacillus sp. SYP-B805]|uniref:iron uptake transporter deferrochelatase/peroxidase subunit n=1 Tax=Brevibacillus sp. SYP-B805 TaxID=1578199 RepID=UPI0013EBC54B|nr:iron uptake transporter deferrochelatase/peroxidase subunit [Brevibacillus sp. SYP-B805]NGQ94961.1 deferrochelatase/peroxidase EfeB [Brevibacillus sp. SYP-B805]